VPPNTISERLAIVETKLTGVLEDMTTDKGELQTMLTDMKASMEKNANKRDERLDKLEKIVWVAIGATTVLQPIISRAIENLSHVKLP